MPLRTLAKRCKRFTPLLAAPAALLLIQGEAKAILTYNIFESAGDVVVQASGSLDLTGATSIGTTDCGPNGLIWSSSALICTGPSLISPRFAITGPSSFNGSAFAFASSATGLTTYLNGFTNLFSIDSSYTSNTSIVSSAAFNGTTLAGLGFTTTGLIGTWTLNGTSETIQVILGAPTPPPAAVPGPLPLLGAGAAFGWSRRFRKRIATPLITPPQA
jgi:MYXO-CTERM domain-containing protein